MIVGYSAADVRAAEAPLLAQGEPLMERAALAIALAAVRLLRGSGGSDGLGSTGSSSGTARRHPRLAGRSVCVLVGSGNNGGDALYAGALLAQRGMRVTALLLAHRHHEAGALALAKVGGLIHPLVADADSAASSAEISRWAHAATTADLIIDGILGTGAVASPSLRGDARDLILAIREHSAQSAQPPLVLAVDVPSGINADDGTVPDQLATVRANLTVTLGAMKAGLLLDPAAGFAGVVDVIDIGLSAGLSASTPDVRRLEPADLVREGLVAEPDRIAHKYRRGVLGLVAGTTEFPGAAVLAASGASGVGIGMIRYLGPTRVARAVLAQRPEVVAVGGQVQAWALGSGCGAWDAAAVARAQTSQIQQGVPGPTASFSATQPVDQQLRQSLQAMAQAVGSPDSGLAEAATPVPTVVDAGALSLLPVRVPATVVLTPHAGELARLLTAHGQPVSRADVEAEPLRWASLAHQVTGATVLLKGAVTVVVGPDGCWSQEDGTPWLASAGAGDVLAGILGALLAQHADDVLADPGRTATVAAAAALIHGRAARRASAGGPLTALGVAAEVAPTIAELLRLA